MVESLGQNLNLYGPVTRHSVAAAQSRRNKRTYFGYKGFGRRSAEKWERSGAVSHVARSMESPNAPNVRPSPAAAFQPGLPVVQSFDDTSARNSGDALWNHLGFQVEPCVACAAESSKPGSGTKATIGETAHVDAGFGPFRQLKDHVRHVIVAIPPGLDWYERNTRAETPPRSPPLPAQAFLEGTYYPAADAHEDKKEPEVVSLLSSSPSADGRDQEELREVVADAPVYIIDDDKINVEDQTQPHLDASWSYNVAEQQAPGTLSQPQQYSTGSSPKFYGGVAQQDPGFVSYFPPPSPVDDYQEAVQSVECDPATEFDSHGPEAMNIDYDGSESPQTVICIDSDHEDDDGERDYGENDESEHDNSEINESEDIDIEDDDSNDEYTSPAVVDLTSSPSPAESMSREGYAPEPEPSLEHDDEMGYLIDEAEDHESNGSSGEWPSGEQDDENVLQPGPKDVLSSDTIVPDDVDMESAHSDESEDEPTGIGDLARDSLSPRSEYSDQESNHLGNLARDSLSDLREHGLGSSRIFGNETNHQGPMDQNGISPFPDCFEGTPVAADNASYHASLFYHNSLWLPQEDFQRPSIAFSTESTQLSSLARGPFSILKNRDEQYHSAAVVSHDISPSPQDFESTPVTPVKMPNNLGLKARDSLSPLRKNFMRPSIGLGYKRYQLGHWARDSNPFLQANVQRPSIALEDDGLDEEVDLLPVQPEVAPAFNQPRDSPQLYPEMNSRLAPSSDQDRTLASYVSVAEYVHQPTESQPDPLESSLVFSEGFHSALSHFVSSPPPLPQNTPNMYAVQSHEYMVQSHQSQGNQHEAQSPPVPLGNSIAMTSAEEVYPQTFESDPAAEDNSLNDILLLQQQLDAEQQNPLPSEHSQERLQYFSMACALNHSISLGHSEDNSRQELELDANKSSNQLNETDAMRLQLQSEHLANTGNLHKSPPSSQTVAGYEESSAQFNDKDGSYQATGPSESENGGVSLVLSGGKPWNMDAVEEYYRNQRELEGFLDNSSSIAGEESDHEDNETVRHQSPISDEENDDEGTEIIRNCSSVSDTEGDEDSDDYVRYDENPETDEEDNEHHIQRSQYDNNQMAGLYEDDDTHNMEQNLGDVEAYEDEDCEDSEHYNDSSDPDENDQAEWTIYTKNTMESLYQEDSETSEDTEMDEGDDMTRAPKSFTADSDKENRIPEWLLMSHAQTVTTTPSTHNNSNSNIIGAPAATQPQPHPINMINIHAAQHYLAAPSPALSPSPLSTSTTASATGPAYDADHTWERTVTASIPATVEEISIDELHALAQTGHADAMQVCAVNRAEAAIDAAAAGAFAMLIEEQARESQLPQHMVEHERSPSPSPPSSPSAQQLQRENWRAASAPAPAARGAHSLRYYGELGGSELWWAGAPRARTRSRSPERWRVPSWEEYRQRD
ncbi:hypothetical protein BKA81DRAFT_420764 [Phyllosticta paracitricarpa]